MRTKLFVIVCVGMLSLSASAQDADGYAVTPEAKAELHCLRGAFEEMKKLLDSADRATMEMPISVLNRMDFDLYIHEISGGALDYRGVCGLKPEIKRTKTVWTSKLMNECLDQDLVKLFGHVNGERIMTSLPKSVASRGAFQKYLYEDLNAAIPYQGLCGL